MRMPAPPLHLGIRYMLAFAALTILCGTSHEFVHHFVGAALCGDFGTKTFNSFTLAPGCADNLSVGAVAALAGPLFTFGLLWLGRAQLRRSDPAAKRRGWALVFANFPINRMFFVLLGANDEQYAGRLMFGERPLVSALAIVVVWASCIPPLHEAWRQLRAQRRWLWFGGFFVLPFVGVVVVIGFLESSVLPTGFLAQEFLGIPALIFVVEALSLATYISFRSALVAALAPPA